MSLHMVVLGDSVMWGQGLLEEHKFHTQLKHHLAALTQMEVIEHVYAHSGATIWPKDSADGNTPLWGEVPVAFPSITAQLVRAKRETNTLRTVLVLVNGGINDVELVNIAHPAANPDQLHALVQERVGRLGPLVADIVGTFANALVVVPSYFHIVSEFSDTLLVKKLPMAIDPGGQLAATWDSFFIPRLIRLSEAFAQASRDVLRRVVDAGNGVRPGRVFFADAGFGPQNALGAPGTWLWNGNDDPLAFERLNYYMKHIVPYPQTWWYFLPNPAYTPIASIAHPNVQGAGAYAEAARRLGDALWAELKRVAAGLPAVGGSLPPRTTTRTPTEDEEIGKWFE